MVLIIRAGKKVQLPKEKALTAHVLLHVFPVFIIFTCMKSSPSSALSHSSLSHSVKQIALWCLLDLLFSRIRFLGMALFMYVISLI
jgi:hypothetical protein